MYGFRRYKTPTTNAYLDIMQHYHLFNEDYFILKEMACWMSKQGTIDRRSVREMGK